MKILVAEDDPVSSLVLSRALERLGHKVLLATNGEAALNRFRAEPCPTVVSDWMMPGMDGLELCGKIRALAPERYTYVVLLTAKTQPEDRLLALSAGVDDFLTKPIDMPDLTARIRVAERITSWQRQLEETNQTLLASSKALAVQAAEMNRLRMEAEHLASHDSLTALLNRRAWFAAAGSQLYSSLAVFDIDRFKLVNDRYGHPVGDAVLRWVATTLARSIGSCGLVGRLGGEEFGVLFDLPDFLAEQVARRAVEAFLADPFTLEDGQRLSVHVSAGFAHCPLGVPGGRNGVVVAYEEADRALYEAKAAGRGRLITRYVPAA